MAKHFCNVRFEVIFDWFHLCAFSEEQLDRFSFTQNSRKEKPFCMQGALYAFVILMQTWTPFETFGQCSSFPVSFPYPLPPLPGEGRKRKTLGGQVSSRIWEISKTFLREVIHSNKLSPLSTGWSGVCVSCVTSRSFFHIRTNAPKFCEPINNSKPSSCCLSATFRIGKNLFSKANPHLISSTEELCGRPLPSEWS